MVLGRLGILVSILLMGAAVQNAQASYQGNLKLSMDEGSGQTALDSSGDGHNGKLLGGPAYVTDTADGSPYALRFDGSNDYIDLGSLDVKGGGLTLAAWFKADRYPGNYRDPRIISKASGTAANDHVFMLGTIKSGEDTVLRARVRVNGVTKTLIADRGKLQTGVWQHASATYDGTRLRLYLNGVEVGATSLSGKVDVDPALRVAVGSQPGGKTRFFDGKIDDVRIMDRALSPVDLQNLVQGKEQSPESFPGLVNLYFNEGKGQLALDSGSFGHNGKLIGGPAYVADTADGSAYALRFDGSNDYVDLGSLDVKGDGLTLAAWFKADRYPGSYRDPRIISKASGTAANDHVFMLGTIKSGEDTVLRARVRVNGVTKTLIADRGKLQTGVWQHASATYDGKRLRLYLNGVEVGATSLSGKVDVDPSLRVAVGSQPGGKTRLFDGKIDNVQILERALSLQELQVLAAGKQASSSGQELASSSTSTSTSLDFDSVFHFHHHFDSDIDFGFHFHLELELDLGFG